MIIKNKIIAKLISAILIATLALSSVAFASENEESIQSNVGSYTYSENYYKIEYKQSIARRLANLINQYRADNNKSSLTYDYGIEKVLIQRAAEYSFMRNFILEDGAWVIYPEWHIRPDGTEWWTAIQEFYPEIRFLDPDNGLYLGQVVSTTETKGTAYFFEKEKTTSEEDMLKRFKADSVWNRQLLVENFNYFAVGCVRTPDKDYYVLLFSTIPFDQNHTEPLDEVKDTKIKIRNDLLEKGIVVTPGTDDPSSNDTISNNEDEHGASSSSNILKSSYKTQVDISSLISTPRAVKTKYKSSSKKIAKVNKKGIVTGGKKAGSATITKYVKYSKGSSWEEAGSVTIQNYYPKLPKKQNLSIGSTVSMNSLLTGMDETPIDWESSKPNVVSVTSDGTATALSKGTAKLTPVFSSGKAKVKTTIKVK